MTAQPTRRQLAERQMLTEALGQVDPVSGLQAVTDMIPLDTATQDELRTLHGMAQQLERELWRRMET